MMSLPPMGLVSGTGIEPVSAGPQPAVLPLHYRAVCGERGDSNPCSLKPFPGQGGGTRTPVSRPQTARPASGPLPVMIP